MSSRLYEDPVVAEIHAIRDKMVSDCQGDHAKLMQQVRERQRASRRKIISTPVEARRKEHSAARRNDGLDC
jgi:hypothetical protein